MIDFHRQPGAVEFVWPASPEPCVQVRALTLTCSVASASSFPLSGPQFSFLENGGRHSSLGYFLILF